MSRRFRFRFSLRTLAIFVTMVWFAQWSIAGRADEQESAKGNYKLNVGDILGVYVTGALGSAEAGLPVSVPTSTSLSVVSGYPIRIREDGCISLPWVSPVNVKDKTILEAQSLVEGAYSQLFEKKHPDLPQQRPTVAVTFIRKRKASEPNEYRVGRSDVLGVFIGGILPPVFEEQPPVHLTISDQMLPSLGFPIPVDELGQLWLPLVEPLPVVGKTLGEVEELIRNAFLVKHEILSPRKLNRILVSPVWIAADKPAVTEPHRLRPGDIVAIVMIDQHDEERKRLLHFGAEMIRVSNTGQHLPFWGFPFQVRSDGTLALPLIPPVSVNDLTLAEVRKRIIREYTIDSTILKPPPDVLLSLIREPIARKGSPLDEKLDSEDLLCIYGLPGKRPKKRDFFFPKDAALAPCFGELVPVLSDGKILLPLAGSIEARGKTLDEIKQTTESTYQERGVFQNGDFVIVQLAQRRP